MNIDRAIQAIGDFQGQSLTRNISTIESLIIGLGTIELETFCGIRSIDSTFMSSAASIKKVAGQINVIIHAAGILCSLPKILKPGEVIESVSLGAGNTGRQFDLETNFRIAEFKFIDWQGGSESIRQNGIFKDFYELVEHDTPKSKHLYVVGTSASIKFLQGNRSLTSVLSRYPSTLGKITEKYGTEVKKACDYYSINKSKVNICDISPYIGRVTS